MRARLLPEILIEAIFAREPLSRDEQRAVIDAATTDPVVLRHVVDVLIAHIHQTPRGLENAVHALASDAKVRSSYKAALGAHRHKRGKVTPTKTNPAKVDKLAAADPRLPSLGLGELAAVVVRAPCGRTTTHPFRVRPVLAHNETGLLILGGRYHVGPRGLVG